MSDVTEILFAIDRGDRHASEELLPLVYDDLRRLARSKLAHEAPGQTLQPTALVHEAWMRLVGGSSVPGWDSRRHFFAAAAEAMRRILVECARRKHAIKRGGLHQRQSLEDFDIAAPVPPDELLALNEALDKLERTDAEAAQLVKLRFFSGLTVNETADVLGISERTVRHHWTYARAWLYREIGREISPQSEAEVPIDESS